MLSTALQQQQQLLPLLVEQKLFGGEKQQSRNCEYCKPVLQRSCSRDLDLLSHRKLCLAKYQSGGGQRRQTKALSTFPSKNGGRSYMDATFSLLY